MSSPAASPQPDPDEPFPLDSEAPSDCQDCGVCCLTSNPDHIPVMGGDHALMTRAEQHDLVVFRGNCCFMRIQDGRCVNLVEAEGRFHCAIYERRPGVCRIFERGSPECAAARNQGAAGG